MRQGILLELGDRQINEAVFANHALWGPYTRKRICATRFHINTQCPQYIINVTTPPFPKKGTQVRGFCIFF